MTHFISLSLLRAISVDLSEGALPVLLFYVIAFMNNNFGGIPGQSNLTLQPWFHLFEESFGRWSQLGSVTYQYQAQDDRMTLPSSNGVLGVRGDIRIGGINIDGPSNTLAFTYLPPSGSGIVIDTGDLSYFTNPTNNFRSFRNTLMHEIGHGFGLLHVKSSNALLMDPFSNDTFDGPQLDEVRGLQFFFGDTNERSHNGQGNDTALLATSLGAITSGSSQSVGAGASGATQAISSTATDFVSISNGNDVDFYSFTTASPSLLNATLTPRGGVFTQASENQTPTTFNANARNNLEIAIFDLNGTPLLPTVNNTAAGVAESITDLLLPAGGTYFARVTGIDDTIQLYELTLSIPAGLPGDFDHDDDVDGRDILVWQRNPSVGNLSDWQANYRTPLVATSVAVPEPATGVLLSLTVAIGMLARRRRISVRVSRTH